MQVNSVNSSQSFGMAIKVDQKVCEALSKKIIKSKAIDSVVIKGKFNSSDEIFNISLSFAESLIQKKRNYLIIRKKKSN